MSWSGFKKNVGRATTQVMMKTGHVEKTSDRGYEVEERRYRTLESASLRLQKEAKGYLDSLRAMTASQMRIAETIDAFYGDSGATDGVSRSYKQAVEDLDAETVKALDGPYRLVDIPKDMYPSGKSRLYHYLATEDSLLPHLLNEKTDGLNEDLVAEIESEYYSTKRRVDEKRVVDIMDEYRQEHELIDSICRTTVLEPINRFCAYFPDINECIKKRNHKMLDYDSMRSKVRRLTDKPDKDASKLPRAEKEADMVSLTDFLDEHRTCPPHAFIANAKKAKKERKVRDASTELASLRDLESEAERDLVMPSPLKLVRRMSVQKTISPMSKEKRMSRRSSSVASGWGSNLLARFAELPSPIIGYKYFDETTRTPSRMPSTSSKKATSAGSFPAIGIPSTTGPSVTESARPARRHSRRGSSPTLGSPVAASGSNYSITTGLALTDTVASSTDDLLPNHSTNFPTHISPALRSVTSPLPKTPTKPTTISTPYGDLPISPLLYSTTFSTNPRNIAPSPFFSPSELQDIMAPLKRAFVQQRANELRQAKAAYEQLNEQLSTELPQLIDLRVPYLDPSFEALVKIQLRFCAEAYSRMAQVQQYLDPQTRDQYANGELDQRVEDVLGQIRELSIAGTV